MTTNLPVPEFEAFRTLDGAADVPTAAPTWRIQSEARLEQILTLDPAPTAPRVLAGRRATARRIAAATAATAVLGFGGATAAAAVGIDNPVGDWFADRLGWGWVTASEPVVVGDEICQDGVMVDVPDGYRTNDAQQASGVWAAGEQVLAGIDFAALPGGRPFSYTGPETPDWVVAELAEAGLDPDIVRDPSSLNVSTGDAEFWTAINAQFAAGLEEAGFDPAALVLSYGGGCAPTTE